MQLNKVSFFIVLLLIAVHTGMAQPPHGYKWTEEGNGYFAAENGEIVKYELPAFTKTIIVSKEKLTPANASAPITIRNFFFSEDNKQVLIYNNSKKVWRYDTRGDYWLLNLVNGRLKKLGKGFPESSLMFAKFSPDGKKVAYVSSYNIYVEDITTGKISPLTTGGTRKKINGTFDWAYEEEFFCRDGFRWSPDSKKIAYWQIDAAKTRD